MDNAASLLASLMLHPEVSGRLQHHLTDMGVHLLLKSRLKTGKSKPVSALRWQASVLNRCGDCRHRLTRGDRSGARRAGVAVNRGVCVMANLQTSHPYLCDRRVRGNPMVRCCQLPATDQLSAMATGEKSARRLAPLKLPACWSKSKRRNCRCIWRENSAPRFKLTGTAESDGMIAKGMRWRRPASRLCGGEPRYCTAERHVVGISL